jgi:hypothetical protein
VRPLVLEEKRSLTSSSSNVLDQHLARVANQVTELIRGAEIRGNHARAIGVRSDLARLLGLIMQGRTDKASAESKVVLLVTAWSNNSDRVPNKRLPRSLRVGTTEWERARVRLVARLFTNYARQHGHADIAQKPFIWRNRLWELLD